MAIVLNSDLLLAIAMIHRILSPSSNGRTLASQAGNVGSTPAGDAITFSTKTLKEK